MIGFVLGVISALVAIRYARGAWPWDLIPPHRMELLMEISDHPPEEPLVPKVWDQDRA